MDTLRQEVSRDAPAGGGRASAGSGEGEITFATCPERYRHWQLSFDGPVATLALDVDEDGGLEPGYELKLNTYDLGVDIELHDAVQRLRFEHPEVNVVVLTSAKERVFSAGANIQMLAQASHGFKVNFCKFTNETRNGIEDACVHSGQRYLAALNGPAAGGGYELALATDHLLLVDDNAAAVSLPEVALLGVLPGTGGLTRLVDKRKVRRDLADVVSTRAEGTRGARALEWGLVDELAPRSSFLEAVARRAGELAGGSAPRGEGPGVALPLLEAERAPGVIGHRYVRAVLDTTARTVAITIAGPERPCPAGPAAVRAEGADFWPLRMALELDDVLLWLRFNAATCGTWLLKSAGDESLVRTFDEHLVAHADGWFENEVIGLIRRVLRRLETSGRSLFALVEPGSCFAGSLLELAFAADRAYMADGPFGGDGGTEEARLALTDLNFGRLEMDNGLTRLETRFLGDPARLARLRELCGRPLEAGEALAAGLVTFSYDEIDWEDEIRMAVEERASFSPDALTAMEANLRFAGPETCVTKIFGRLSAWQNWVFQRPSASGPEGALRRYGTGSAPVFSAERT